MPEINNTFVKGKMNQDLDERLVPSGEYRDAINLEISTSEGSNVGSLQNILGNDKKNNSFIDPQTNQISVWSTGGIESISGKKIGSFVDNQNDSIYWFIAGDGISAIAEFVQASNVVVPILVDTQNILNFSEDYLITGINVIEGNLYWTDNQTEPKTININKWKKYSTQTNGTPYSFTAHTQLPIFQSQNTRDWEEADITVIKKQPLSPPTLTLLDTFRPGVNSTFYFDANFSYEDPNNAGSYIPIPPRTTFTITTVSDISGFKVGDNIEALSIGGGTVPEEAQGGEAKFQVKSLPVYSTTNSNYEMECIMGSWVAPVEFVINSTVSFQADLIEPDGIFKLDFVRFAYRYKFDNNQYSPLGPFSEIAFKPTGIYEWDSTKGFNSSMENSVKTIELSNFEVVENVKEVEILYKNDSSNVIYSVSTIQRGDIFSGYKYTLDTELIHSVIDSNQILRPWDNVPRLAKSQEVISNRIVYGNYLQNFNVDESQKELNFSFSTQDFVDVDLLPQKTIKTDRAYQAGVVYMDKYGRQSPVFSSSDSAIEIDKKYAAATNSMQIKGPALSDAPSWATHFKYFIKDASSGYYNLAMDRYYIAEDGNFWLSFPSSDRNKITEESFIELKKAHGSEEPVLEKAKFKVLDIANEAPDFIKTKTTKIGEVIDDNIFDAGDYPAVNAQYIDIKKSEVDSSSAKGVESKSGVYLSVQGNFRSTQLIGVASISLFGSYYRFHLRGNLPLDMDEIVGSSQDLPSDLGVRFFIKEILNKPEFTGRFFVKLDSQSLAKRYIAAEVDEELASGFAVSASVSNIRRTKITDTNNKTPWRNHVKQGWSADESYSYRLTPSGIRKNGFGLKSGETKISISYHGQRPAELGNDRTSGDAAFISALKTPGTKIAITGIGGNDDTVYQIRETRAFWIRNYNRSKTNGFGRFNESDIDWSSNKRARFDLVLDKPIEGVGVVDSNFPLNYKSASKQSTNTFGIKILTSLDTSNSFSSSSPAIFETEPAEQAELDIYFEATKAFPISELNSLKTLDYYNAFSFGNGVESNRIRDDFNAPTIAKGVKASSTLSEPYQEDRLSTGLIYSGIFNSTSGTNELNQFIQALPITKNLDPVYSSIQKLHARDTNLVVFCEDKVLRVYADKDALFNADGNTNLVSTNRVLGNADAFAGEFGISKNPESFASYGFRAYFTDSNRGVVCRLSNNGIEVISDYGMVDFFADNLSNSSNIVGSFDDDKSSYNISVCNLTDEWKNKFKGFTKAPGSSSWTEYTPNDTVLSFKEKTNGWESRKSFSKYGGVSLNDVYYTFEQGEIWEHNIDSVDRGCFYGVHFDSAVKFLVNELPASAKKFKALNYTGSNSKEYRYQLNSQSPKLSIAQIIASNITPTIETVHKEGWYAKNLTTDLQSGFIKEFANKENKFFQKITGDKSYFNSLTDNNLDARESSVQGLGSPMSITGDYVTYVDISFFVDPACFTIIP